jgi:hypothetical protein
MTPLPYRKPAAAVTSFDDSGVSVSDKKILPVRRIIVVI